MEKEEIIEQWNKANMYIKKRKFAEAENVLNKLLKAIDPIEIDKYGKVLDFNSQLEFVLYCNMDKHQKISWNRNFLSEIYTLLGVIQFDNRKYKEAISYYEKALRWNPVSFSVHSEILESYINMKNFEKFNIWFEKAIRISVMPIEIAILYKKAAFVYIEKGLDEVAYNLLLYSKLFFPRPEADQEIAYLEKKMGTKLKYYPDLGTINYLKERGIEYKTPPYIIPTLVGLINAMANLMKKEKFQTRENYLTLIDYYHALYFHKPDSNIHSLMLATQREYEIKFRIGREEKK